MGVNDVTRRRRGNGEKFLQKETKETKVGTKGVFGFVGARGRSRASASRSEAVGNVTPKIH